MIILLTGESGVGKTSAAKTLMNRHPGILLDGDDMRDGLNSDLGFSDRDIMENMRRAAHIAVLLHDQLPEDRRTVYITCIAPLLAGRNLVHELCGSRLWEIRIQYDYRASDDVKGLYKAGTPMRAYGVPQRNVAAPPPDKPRISVLQRYRVRSGRQNRKAVACGQNRLTKAYPSLYITPVLEHS